MENPVFSELLKMGLMPNSSLFYFSSNNKEVDFIIKKDGKIEQLIQVCYNIDDFNMRSREVKALVKASVELGCNNLVVITWDYEGLERQNCKKTVLYRYGNGCLASRSSLIHSLKKVDSYVWQAHGSMEHP